MTEKSVTLKNYNDETSQWETLYPKTKMENVAGLTEQLEHTNLQVETINTDVTTLKNKMPQKADQSFVDAQLASIVSGAPKGTYADLTSLQTAYPSGTEGVFLVLADGHWYYWNSDTNAWTDGGIYQGTEVGDGTVTTAKMVDKTVTTDKIDVQAVDLENLANPIIYMSNSKNLIDKDALIKGYYVTHSTGKLTANSGFNAIFRRIEPNTTYVQNGDEQIAFYDKNKKHIGGIARTANALPYVSFTTPPNAYLLCTNIREQDIDTRQLEKGSLPTKYEDFKHSKHIDEVLKKSQMNDLLMHLQNPFIKTQVKIIGSSSAAGVGGTGFDTSGDLIMTDAGGAKRYANVLTAYCWSNLFKSKIENVYNRTVRIDSAHPQVKHIAFDFGYGESAGSETRRRTLYPNLINGQTLFEVDFYGEQIGIIYYGNGASGSVDVFVDGVLHSTLNTLQDVATHNLEYVVGGLTKTKHTLKVVGKGNGSIFLQGFNVTKYATVLPYGIKGTNSEYLATNQHLWVTDDDDFVVAQISSNDRGQTAYDFTRSLMTEALKNMKERVEGIYVLSFAPASVSNDSAQHYQMHEITRRLNEIATETDSQFVDVYQAFIDYALLTGTTLDSLLADGLHCNDAGYKLMYQIICKILGISINRSEL